MNRTTAVYLAIALATLAASAFWWGFIIASAASTLAYNIIMRSGSKRHDHELLAFSKEFARVCGSHGTSLALSKCAKDPSAPKEVRELSQRVRLGHSELCDSIPCSDGNIKELLEIIGMSIQNGTDIKNNLRLFISRLEADAESKNQLAQSSLNMDTLSVFGVSFFVPLFGGIGASIISGSGAILGTSSFSTSTFEMIIVAYIAVMSYIMHIFRSGKAYESLFSSFQTTVMAAGIIRLSAAFMAYAI